jgi:acyl-CoA thioesterase
MTDAPERAIHTAQSARAAADAMHASDQVVTDLGMHIEQIAPGVATVSMPVTARMINGHGLCHGGYIYTLADTAFAYACNSYGQRCVAQQCQITYVAPAKLGMHLTAAAIERQRAARSGIYDVTVRDETGLAIAEFRGHSRAIAGTLA